MATTRRVQRILKKHIRGSDLIDDGEIAGGPPEAGEPSANDGFVIVFFRHVEFSHFVESVWRGTLFSAGNRAIGVQQKARGFRHPSGGAMACFVMGKAEHFNRLIFEFRVHCPAPHCDKSKLRATRIQCLPDVALSRNLITNEITSRLIPGATLQNRVGNRLDGLPRFLNRHRGYQDAKVIDCSRQERVATATMTLPVRRPPEAWTSATGQNPAPKHLAPRYGSKRRFFSAFSLRRPASRRERTNAVALRIPPGTGPQPSGP